MKTYRKTIVIVLSAITVISAVVLLNLSSERARAAYTGYVTEEKYQILKDYALEIANNSNTELKEGLKVTKEFSKESLIINVDASIYGVIAKFPISNYEEKIENGIIKSEGIIDYNNVTYLEHTQVYSPILYIALSVILVMLLTGVVYYFLYYFLPDIKKLTQKH